MNIYSEEAVKIKELREFVMNAKKDIIWEEERTDIVGSHF